MLGNIKFRDGHRLIMVVCIIFGPFSIFIPCARLQKVTQRLFVFGGVTWVAISATIMSY
jgi:hypothetical protein